MNSVITYNLPAYSDLEGNPVFLALLPTLSFVSLAGNSIIISPVSFSDVGIHTMSLTLSDGQPLSTPYSFKITVTNSAPTFTTLPADQTLAMNSV